LPDKQEDFVTVGKVGRPHGLAGAFVVERPSEDAARFAMGAVLHVDGEPAEVTESKRGGGGRVVIRLDRKVERGAVLQVPKADLAPTGDDDYYVFELIGLEVVEEGGRTLGRVKDVASYQANDVLEVEGGLGLPMVAECVRDVDLEAGRIVVAKGFAP
jgi:16S rRNA processing protein RimM